MNWWEFDQLSSAAPYDWRPATRGDSPWDAIDFHLDLGCGTVSKARLGIDRHYAPGVQLGIDLEKLQPVKCSEADPPQYQEAARLTHDLFRENVDGDGLWRLPRLPFPTDSIESIVSHHCLEHIRDGFIPLMDEVHRVLKPGGIFRAITPLFPSRAAIEDPDHKRYFMIETWGAFCGGANGEHFHESFSVPYTSCRFEMVDLDYTARLDDPAEWWGPDDVREIRVALRKYGPEVANVSVAQHQGQVSQGRADDQGDDLDALGGHSEAGGDRELAGVI